LDRDVAVKMLPRERIVGGRFEREARAAARLAHPGIVTLYEAAVDDEGAYLVSELVRGATLDRLLDEGRLSDRDIVSIGSALCEALEHAHAHGVVHRDVKPSNILIPRGAAGAQVAKLTDFGVARVLGGDTLTRTGDVIGTAAYMAPEQAEGREAGATADLYSLAVVIYEALTGVNPIPRGTAAQRARRLGAHLPPLRRQRRDLPRDLGRAIDLALRPRPRERGTIEELRRALAAAAHQVADNPGVVADAWAPRKRDETEEPADMQRVPQSDPDAEPVEPPEAPQTRALAALAAAAIGAWLDTRLAATAPVAPAAAALVSALLIVAAPRIGWAILATGATAAAALNHRPGVALLIPIAAVIPVALLPRRPKAWPLAAAAPALGFIGLAGAWPAIAGLAIKQPWRRGAVAAAGWLWVVIATPLADHTLYASLAIPSTTVWMPSLFETTHHVIPAVTSAAAPAIVWALGALTLPYTARRSLPATIVLVTVWSAMLASATAAATHAATHGAVLGAVLGGLIALAPPAAAAAAGRPRIRGTLSRDFRSMDLR
jgi:eukaryotic-like serine/threonine-protein kinase